MKIKILSYLFLAFMSTVLIEGCKDKCKDQYCLNGGDCSDGTCICPTGFSGVHCEIASSEGYNCLSGNCSTVSSNAQYVTLSACESACSILSAGYVCASGECYSVPTGAEFATLADCENSFGCEQLQGNGYICDVDENCQQVLSDGTYATLSECESSCGSAGGYDCISNDCVPVSSGGEYDFLGECETFCH